MKRTRSNASKTTQARAQELADTLRSIAEDARAGVLTPPEMEMVERLWTAWGAVHARHARRYLIFLVQLAKREDAKSRAELKRALTKGELRIHMPGLARVASADARVRRDVMRLATIEPLRRGRPPKGAPKERFYAEVVRTLRALGFEAVTQRQVMRDYADVLALQRRRR
jgi:hypothetical protein